MTETPTANLKSDSSAGESNENHLEGKWRDFLADALAQSAVDIGLIEPLPDQTLTPGEDHVADHVYKMLIRDGPGRPFAVGLCAASVSPGLVARGMSRAREAKQAIGPEDGAAILDPLFEGELDGLSCAVLPYCRSLSRNRLVLSVQQRRLRFSLFDWLRQLTSATVSIPENAEIDTCFVTPLTKLAEHEQVPDRLRSEANRALDRLDERAWSPRHVFTHNDMWSGNILIDHRNLTGRGDRPWRERYVIIDWPGANPQGTPIIDLMCLERSFRLDDNRLRHEVESHCQLIECAFSEARSHLLVSLGTMLINLEYFPLPMFIQLADTCMSRLEQIEG